MALTFHWKKRNYVYAAFICINVVFSCKEKQDKNVKIYYYPHSNDIEIKAQIKNKHFHGEYIEYFKDKTIRKKANFVNGYKEGPVINYDEKGNKTIVEYFKENKQDSLKIFYKDNGEIYRLESYKEGKKHGRLKTYYTNGKPFQDFNYSDDKIHGAQRIFYDNGKLKSVEYFNHGNPGMGLEEYDQQGNRLTYNIKILVEEKNKLALESKVDYKFRLNIPSKNDEFFIADLDSNKYLPVGRFALKKEKDYFLHSFFINPNTVFIQNINVVAVTRTKSDKRLVLSKKINVAVTNF